MTNFIIIIDEKHDLIIRNINQLLQHIIYIIDEEQDFTNIID
uniref:Uncharacterized protein n=1 Tax=viral metagenome TaxID=1070528 RepID=A0A6C0EPZ7_9ZZZZ